jgi:hypothetical protein
MRVWWRSLMMAKLSNRPQGVDDGHHQMIKAKLSIALEEFSDINHVFKEDAGLALNFNKTKILVKGISAADAHAAHSACSMPIPPSPQSPMHRLRLRSLSVPSTSKKKILQPRQPGPGEIWSCRLKLSFRAV